MPRRTEADEVPQPPAGRGLLPPHRHHITAQAQQHFTRGRREIRHRSPGHLASRCCRSARALPPARRSRVPGDGGDGLQGEVVVAVEPVADKIDAAPVLAYGIDVVAGEVASEQISRGLLHKICPAASSPSRSRTRCWNSVRWSTSPDRVEQALVDHPGVRRPLVLHDHRRAVLVQAQRVDSSALNQPGVVSLARNRAPSVISL